LLYRDLNLLNPVNIYGIVINKFYKPRCLGVEIPIKRRHWLAVRKIDENYYNLDSKLDAPECIGNDDNLIKFLKSELAVITTEMFLVLPNSLPEDSWIKVHEG
jgi:josephin